MKKKILIVSAMTLLLIIALGCTKEKKNTYALATIVTEVDYTTDTVTCVDSRDYLWLFTGCEDWQVGDGCALVMNDNGTDLIYDDTIESTRFFRVDLFNENY